MSIKILILHNDDTAAKNIRNILEERLSDKKIDVLIGLTKNEEQAKERLIKNDYKLIITHLHIRKDKNTTLNEAEQRGLLFLESIENELNKHICSILITSKIDSELNARVHKLFECSIILEEGKSLWEDDLVNCSIKALKKTSDVTPDFERLNYETKVQKRLNIDFYIKKNSLEGQCHFLPEGFICEPPVKSFKLSPKNINKMIDRSIDLKTAIKWERAMLHLGDELMQEIFSYENREFRDFFNEQKAKAGGLKNLRIRFVVKRDIHPIALEALVDIADEDLSEYQYWMHIAPIYRRVEVDEDYMNYPLFADEETKNNPINCLIIESDVSGYIGSLNINLERLENVKLEVQDLEDHMQNIDKPKKDENDKKMFNKIKVIKANDISREETFKERLRNKLECGITWHIVHYAGHSYYDNEKKIGYLFIPGENGRPDYLTIKEFGQILRDYANTRFIYCSSCHSSEEGFVFELARQKIPAIIGFRWDIVDDKAAEHARVFYKYLFKEKSLEYAFLKTRKDIYNRMERHRIWAAPMLIMQVRDER